MRLIVKHVTRYTYEHPIAHMVQRLRLTPPSHDGQTVTAWSVRADGHDRAARYIDAFGNIVHLISHREALSDVEIAVEGTVETRELSGMVGKTHCHTPDLMFLRMTHLTQANAAIRKLGTIADQPDQIAGLHELMHAIRDRIAYQVGVTEVHTSATDALAAGQGVCQDHAHIFISAARSAGIPARYVSGYMLLEDQQDSEAHHAWAEAKLPTIGWVGFDVSNGMCPSARYIRLAVGLDSRSAAPITGVRGGGLGESMSVEVAVSQEVQQAQQ